MKELDIQYLTGLVLRARQNESDAFSELYAMTYNKVYNYARHYLRDDYLAQDALQEIYISILKNLSKLNDPTLFIAWMNRICFNVCFDMTKKRDSADSSPLSSELVDIIEDKHPLANPEATLQKKDEYSRLMQALESLPFQEHQVIVMRYFNDMKLEDIADACEISRSSVKRYLANGQRTLKQLLKE